MNFGPVTMDSPSDAEIKAATHLEKVNAIRKKIGLPPLVKIGVAAPSISGFSTTISEKRRRYLEHDVDDEPPPPGSWLSSLNSTSSPTALTEMNKRDGRGGRGGQGGRGGKGGRGGQGGRGGYSVASSPSGYVASLPRHISATAAPPGYVATDLNLTTAVDSPLIRVTATPRSSVIPLVSVRTEGGRGAGAGHERDLGGRDAPGPHGRGGDGRLGAGAAGEVGVVGAQPRVGRSVGPEADVGVQVRGVRRRRHHLRRTQGAS